MNDEIVTKMYGFYCKILSFGQLSQSAFFWGGGGGSTESYGRNNTLVPTFLFSKTILKAR